MYASFLTPARPVTFRRANSLQERARIDPRGIALLVCQRKKIHHFWRYKLILRWPIAYNMYFLYELNLFCSAISLIRELQIPRRGRLRERYFPNTKWCARVSQRHFGEKMWQLTSVYYEFQRKCGSDEILMIQRSGVGFTSFNGNKRANFCGEKSTIKLSGVSTFREQERKMSCCRRPRP